MTSTPAPRLAIVIATLALVTALTACSTGTTSSGAAGGSSGPTSSSPTSSGPTAANKSGGSSADINVCSLLSVDQATTLVGKDPYSAATPATIAPGQDQCTYTNTGSFADMVVIVYQPNSGVGFAAVTSASGATTPVSGVGDKAATGDIELDVQAGNRVIAVEAAGGVGFGGSFDGAIAVAKAVIAALG